MLDLDPTSDHHRSGQGLGFERARDTVVPALMRTFGRVEIEVPRDSLVESDGARAGPMSHDPNGTLAAAQPSTQ
jgi:hypothetical protein